jgi:hypothetical protein
LPEQPQSPVAVHSASLQIEDKGITMIPLYLGEV